MRIIAYCITALLPCATALARIGETEQQIEARYGQPIKIVSASELPAPGVTKIYESAGIKILVTFLDGTSASEDYSKASPGQLERSEIETILAANAG